MAIKELRYWVQKVLPLVYDDSLSYYEVLNRVVVKLNEVIELANNIDSTIEHDVEVIMNEWVEDGTFEQLIDQTVLANLTDRISTAENDIDTLEGAVSDLQTESGSLDNRLDTAEGEIDSLQSSVGTLRTDVDGILTREYLDSHRRYVVMSDSYGMGRNSTTPWTTFLKQYLGASDSDYFTYSEGSMGFNLRGEYNHNAQELLQANIGNITTPSTITDVVVAMGANDTLATLGLDTAIVNFIAYALSQFANATVHIGFIGNKISKNATELANFMSAMNQYSSVCQVTPAKEIPGCSCIMHNARLMQADGVHPTTDGSREIAKFINAYLHGEYPVYKAYAKCTLTSSYFDDSGSVVQCIEGNTASIHLDLGIVGESGITFADRNYYSLGTIDSPIIRGTEACPFEFKIRTFAVTSLNPVDLLARVYNGNIYLSRGSIHSTENVSPSVSTYPDSGTLATDLV